MTPEEANNAQRWSGMDGATAWHLIDRHAESWAEVGELMNAWLCANGGGAWIACADKLPQQYVTCIVGRPDIAYPVAAFWTGEKWFHDATDCGMHVTHWRPMPDPPSNAEVSAGGTAPAGTQGYASGGEK